MNAYISNCRNYRNLRKAVLNLTGYEDYDGYDVYEAIHEHLYYLTNFSFNGLMQSFMSHILHEDGFFSCAET